MESIFHTSPNNAAALGGSIGENNQMKCMPLLFLALACAGCGAPAADSPASGEPAIVTLEPAATTEPVARGSLVNPAFWVDPAVPGTPLILGAAGISGVVMYTPDGRRAGTFRDVEAGFVTVVPDPGTAAGPLVVVYDSANAALEAYRLERDGPGLTPVTTEPLPLGDELTGLCHHRSRLSGADYLYAVTDAGVILHFELFTVGDAVGGRLLRRIPVGKGAGYCDVDGETGTLYVSEESVGIWRLGAEPESDTTREPVALTAPWGELSDEVKGVSVYHAGEATYLVAADVGENRLVVLDVSQPGIVARAKIEGLSEAEGLSTVAAFGEMYPAGVIAIADEDESGGGTDLKLLDRSAFAEALGLPPGAALPEQAPFMPATVRPVLETEVARNWGDAADDPAIWVHPSDPAKSLVIGTDKQLGLYVFDLEGRIVQTLPDGRMNNVDLRKGFPLGGKAVTIVAASNRSTDSIAVYRIEPDTGRLVNAAAGVLPTGFTDPYGLCLYESAVSGEFFVFVNEGGDGTFRQWRLYDDGEGRVAAEQVREFPVGSQAEGCVADDATGDLYVAEEAVGLWKYSAEPDGGNTRTLIDTTGEALLEGNIGGQADAEGHLVADAEGVALWTAPDGGGYVVVSSQGANNYVLYERGGDNAYVGTFHIVANAAEGIDGASETDGLDVTSAALGERFPQGLLVVQDGRNIAPEERQNFKYVSFADVLEALDLL